MSTALIDVVLPNELYALIGNDNCSMWCQHFRLALGELRKVSRWRYWFWSPKYRKWFLGMYLDMLLDSDCALTGLILTTSLVKRSLACLVLLPYRDSVKGVSGFSLLLLGFQRLRSFVALQKRSWVPFHENGYEGAQDVLKTLLQRVIQQTEMKHGILNCVSIVFCRM